MKINKTAFFRINKRIDHDLYNRFIEFIQKHKLDPTCELALIFDCYGGEAEFAFKMINLMSDSKLHFYGIAYGNVDSSAIPLFLSCQMRINRKLTSSALIHRANKENEDISDIEIRHAEEQTFDLVSSKLEISVLDVYKMANNNTVIDTRHPLGRKFFFYPQSSVGT